MIRFLKNTGLYLFLLLIVFIILLKGISIIVEKRDFANHETESNLLIIEKEKQYDVVMMGISHARNFSRHNNHNRVESILNKEILNLGQGNGACGINEQQFYLDYFYSKKNKASKVVFFISPPLLFSETLPVASNTFDYEPFKIDFFFKYLSFPSENKTERIFSYLQSKFSSSWVKHHPESSEAKLEKLDSLDISVAKAGQNSAYNDTESFERFEKSCSQLKKTIQLALKNQSEVVLIVPPALFGKWKGHQYLTNIAENIAQQEKVQFYDFSEAVFIPAYYYDHHHLNTEGVIYFTEKFLKPVIN